jgi:hypothetical protein
MCKYRREYVQVNIIENMYKSYTVKLVQSDILLHPTKIYGPKVFLLTKIKPEFSDILYNPTWAMKLISFIYV